MDTLFYHVRLSDTEYMYGDGNTWIVVKKSNFQHGKEMYIKYIHVSNSPKRKKSAVYINKDLSDEYKEKCIKIGKVFLEKEKCSGTEQDGTGIYEKPQNVLDKINNGLYKSLCGKSKKKI